MRVFAGTSGYSYKEWKGPFYPERLPVAKMLQFYAEQLPAVEINNTFYRLPKANVLESWREQVSDDFRFALKASRRITHDKRLKDTEEHTEYLLRTVQILGRRLGVILFQLPPYLRKDLPRLERFLDLLPERTPAAFEFRHQSWLDHDVFDRLRARDFALCIADTDEDSEIPLVATARWGYLRLRRAEYSESALADWVKRLRSQNWDTAYVFFKHEDEGAGPKLATRFLELASPSP
ncbi:MAG: DUF72 domain-containing protein [Acidiferrobacterales bacterium]